MARQPLSVPLPEVGAGASSVLLPQLCAELFYLVPKLYVLL